MPHITLSFNWVTTDIRHFGVAICTFHLGFSLVLQRHFLNLPSSWSEIAPREERPQGWQARGQVAMEMCSRSFYCEPSL